MKAYNHIKSNNLDMVEFNSIYDNVTEIYIINISDKACNLI